MTTNNVSTADNKELADNCYTCKSEDVFENKRPFKGQELAISICPHCRSLNDWELPKELLDEEGDITNQELFDEVAKWAEEEAKLTLIEKNLWYHVQYSRKAEKLLDEELRNKLTEKVKIVVEFLGMQDVYVGIKGKGVIVQFC